MKQRSADNHANTATFGLVVTPEGAVPIASGGSWQGDEARHAAIRNVTDQSVKHVIDTGGQDHRRLCKGDRQAQGAIVIASKAAVSDHHARAQEHKIALAQVLGDGLEGTALACADIAVATDHPRDFGGFRVEYLHGGPAHAPGGSFVGMDERTVMFTGDIVVPVDRLLGNAPACDTDNGIAVFAALASCRPAQIVPGHDRVRMRRIGWDPAPTPGRPHNPCPRPFPGRGRRGYQPWGDQLRL